MKLLLLGTLLAVIFANIKLTLQKPTDVKHATENDDDMSPAMEGLALTLIAIIAFLYSILALGAINAWLQRNADSRRKTKPKALPGALEVNVV